MKKQRTNVLENLIWNIIKFIAISVDFTEFNLFLLKEIDFSSSKICGFPACPVCRTHIDFWFPAVYVKHGKQFCTIIVPICHKIDSFLVTIITQILTKIKYFVVDSATKFVADEGKDLKKLDRSGFREVAEFVNGYIRPNVHRLLVVRGLAEIQPKAEAIFRELDTQEAILQTKTDEDREKKAKEFQDVTHYIKRQGRFKHLTDEDIEHIVESRDKTWERILRNYK